MSKKFPIDNIHVDSVSPLTNGKLMVSYAIGWSIAGDRYHVWVRDGEIEETIYKNPPLHLKRGAPGHFETRLLDRTTKAQAETFATVLARVDRDGLVARAIDDHDAKLARRKRQGELEAAIGALEAEALVAWRTGRFAGSAVAGEMLARREAVEQLLLALGAELA